MLNTFFPEAVDTFFPSNMLNERKSYVRVIEYALFHCVFKKKEKKEKVF